MVDSGLAPMDYDDVVVSKEEGKDTKTYRTVNDALGGTFDASLFRSVQDIPGAERQWHEDMSGRHILAVYLLECFGTSGILPSCTQAVRCMLITRSIVGGVYTHVIKTTSHFPSFKPDSPSFSKSIAFCSSFSLPANVETSVVRRRPYSPTLL